MLRFAPILISLLAACGDDTETFVLVHGAFMDDSGWTPVADRLRADGHTVIIPELPAHGGDATPASAATLAGYVERVGAALDAADAPAIVVGHSMAGVVITQLAANRPDDIAELIYVAAYVPTEGQSLLDLAMTDASSELGAHLVFQPDGTVAIDDAFADLFCADCPAEAAAALRASYHAEPGGPLGEKVALAPGLADVGKTYVHTARDRVVSPSLQDRMVAATPMDREVTLDTSHAAMLAAPDQLVEALLER